MLHNSTYIHHYTVFAFILAAGMLGIAWFRSNQLFQQLILWATLACYVLWGIIHHSIRKDLTLTVLLEYLFIGGVAGYFTQSVLLVR